MNIENMDLPWSVDRSCGWIVLNKDGFRVADFYCDSSGEPTDGEERAMLVVELVNKWHKEQA